MIGPLFDYLSYLGFLDKLSKSSVSIKICYPFLSSLNKTTHLHSNYLLLFGLSLYIFSNIEGIQI